ncbi:MAG: SusD/RagB family nutrient-binding outer membrane lipoprotein [Dysgonamonadaceae bacterium]|jgi:hypothetical protein|nr:SusD/RagB family nutrient-binding outer membrane lipoprotein [Dysgonamonadaceae bacterium]
MKKIISILVLLTCVFTFSRCSEEDYNEKYSDPNKVTSLLMDKLMVGLFTKENGFNVQGYGRYFNTDSQWLGRYAQTFGFYVGNTMYHNGYGVDGYYGELYTSVANFKKLEDMYNNLAEAEKPSYEAYYLASKVVIYNHLLAILDIYGNVPWSDACRVAVTGDFANSNAHFDNSADLYKMIIDELKDVSLRFASVSKPKDFTTAQDFINKADFEKWRAFANSIRLRAAMRVASNGSLTTEGRAAVKEILDNPAQYPVVEDNEGNIQIVNLRADPVNGGPGGFDWKSCQLASAAIIRNTLSNYSKATYSGTYQDGIDDPRLPLLYSMATPTAGKLVGKLGVDPNREEASVYRGTDPEMPEQVQSQYDAGNSLSLIRQYGFFWDNKNFDHQIFSAAETWFIKAEAYLNGWATGDAKTAFKEGVSQSIKFFFKYNSTKSEADVSIGDAGTDQRGWVINPPEPDDAWINAFAEARWSTRINGGAYDAANPQLDAILTQKWLSYNIMYVREAWSDLRRTGYPSGLVFPSASDSEIPNVPNRWKYPPGERDFNKNFSEVADQDNYSGKLFWAK